VWVLHGLDHGALGEDQGVLPRLSKMALSVSRKTTTATGGFSGIRRVTYTAI
jgi:hypothetical protein